METSDKERKTVRKKAKAAESDEKKVTSRKKKSSERLIALVEDVMDEVNYASDMKAERVVIDEPDMSGVTHSAELAKPDIKHENTKSEEPLAPEKRRCSRCRKIKPLDEFNFQNIDKKQKMYICKECEKIKNKEKHDRRKGMINELKSCGCAVCGESEPCCLDFHHIDPADKEFGIGSASNKTDKKIIEEAAKCVVVCSNCHRKIHNGIIDIYDYINPSQYKYLRQLVELSQMNVSAQETSHRKSD